MSDIIEENKQEPKQTNFRIRPDDADKFRELCITLGYNQADGFEYILRTLDLENAKKSAPGRADEIDQFRHFAYSLVEMYSQSIEYSLQADAKAHDAVDRSMKAKDETIADLQEKNKKLEERLATLKNEMSTNELARRAAVKENEDKESQLRNANLSLYDKNKMIDMLQKQLDACTEKAKLYDELKPEYEKVREESRSAIYAAEKEKNDAIQQVRSDMQGVVDQTKAELTESKLREKELSSQLAIAQNEKEAAKAIAEAEMRTKYEAEIKELREKYEAEAHALRTKLEQRTEELLSVKNKGGKSK